MCGAGGQPVIVQASLVRAGGGKGGSSLIVTGYGAEQGKAMVARARNFVLGYCGQIVEELKVPPFWKSLKDKKVSPLTSHARVGTGPHTQCPSAVIEVTA
jgi:hypothetical protein